MILHGAFNEPLWMGVQVASIFLRVHSATMSIFALSLLHVPDDFRGTEDPSEEKFLNQRVSPCTILLVLSN